MLRLNYGVQHSNDKCHIFVHITNVRTHALEDGIKVLELKVNYIQNMPAL